MGLSESAASGDRLAALKDLRDKLAVQIDGSVSLRDIATASARLQSVLEEIASLDVKPEGDGIDEIAERRAARRTVRPKGQVRPG